MTKITLLTVGKLKEDFLPPAAAEYQKRLSRYCRLEIIEVADEKTPDGAGAAEEEAVRRKEGERLKKYIRDGAMWSHLKSRGKCWIQKSLPGGWTGWPSREKAI